VALSFSIVGLDQLEWFLPRSGRAAIRPTPRRLPSPQPIVVLITIDAFRRDVFFDPAQRAALPNLAALAADGTVFTDARSTASSTSPAIASIFSGKYYSQRYWAPARIGQADRPFLQEDTATRFPELLARRGISTGAFPSTIGLLQQYGVSRGFRHEHPFGEARNVTSDVLARALIAWLPDDGRPAFGWMHMLDAHAPYVLGGKEGTAFERYVRELTMADAIVGKVVAGLRAKNLWDRTLLIVTSDHGEAFGEHGASYHGKNVYDEVARVPMVMAGGGIARRTFDAPVSIVDLGPTILDAFGVATPGDFMGQSLLPAALGDEPALTRPIAMDHSKGHQALVFSDGIKVLCKRGASTCEIYDLRQDPSEEDNVVDDRPDMRARIGALNAFFEAHALKKPGYELPTR
jgi:arylsulfatase A-like enzyme